MAYNVGLLLSAVYMMATLLLGGDVYCLIAVRNNLDAIALTVSYRISMEGRVSDSILQFVENEGACFEDLTHYVPPVGGTYVFEIYKEYTPIVISKQAMRVAVRRSTIVGFYETYN